MDICARLGSIIRRLREKEGWSQEEHAHFTGIHRTDVCDIERGTGNPTITVVEKLARPFDVKPRHCLSSLQPSAEQWKDSASGWQQSGQHITWCFACWAWLRMDRSPLWLVPGIASLCLFACLLTLVEEEHAGRTYAAHGGIYILSALAWLWIAEGVRPDRWDLLGVSVCLVGASIILWAPRPI